MMEGLFQIALVLWVGFACVLALAVEIVHRCLRGALQTLAPDLRAVVLRALLLAPVVGSTFLVFLGFAPKLAGILVPSLDHCLTHGDHHLHFCFTHAPDPIFGAWFWAGAAVLIAVAGGVFARCVRELRTSWHHARSLERMAGPHATREVWVIPSAEPVAFSVGFGARRTLVSTALLDALSPSALDVVLAHEDAHRERRDGLWNALVHLVAWTHLPVTARALRDDLATACEQDCDERAVARVGDRSAVATALLAVARMHVSPPSSGPALLAFGAPRLESRVRSLIDGAPRRRLPRGGAAIAIASIVGAAVLIADPLHHALETIFHVLVG